MTDLFFKSKRTLIQILEFVETESYFKKRSVHVIKSKFEKTELFLGFFFLLQIWIFSLQKQIPMQSWFFISEKNWFWFFC